MVIFHSYVSLPEGNVLHWFSTVLEQWFSHEFPAGKFPGSQFECRQFQARGPRNVAGIRRVQRSRSLLFHMGVANAQ